MLRKLNYHDPTHRAVWSSTLIPNKENPYNLITRKHAQFKVTKES